MTHTPAQDQTRRKRTPSVGIGDPRSVAGRPRARRDERTNMSHSGGCILILPCTDVADLSPISPGRTGRPVSAYHYDRTCRGATSGGIALLYRDHSHPSSAHLAVRTRLLCTGCEPREECGNSTPGVLSVPFLPHVTGGPGLAPRLGVPLM